MTSDHKDYYSPVPGKPNVYVTLNADGCEWEIYRVECTVCGKNKIVYYSACGCDAHAPDPGGHDYASHEGCPKCGNRMSRLDPATA